MQPRLAIGKGHDIGKPGEGDKGRIRFPANMLQAQHGTPVMDLALEEGVDLPGAPPAALGRGRHRLTRGCDPIEEIEHAPVASVKPYAAKRPSPRLAVTFM